MYNSARYSIIRQIGRGGMSCVYLCADNNIHKKWAIKKIPLKCGDLNLINSEINLLKSLDYYMFPRIVDAYIEDEEVVIVTDYIEGESLDEYIKREGPLSVNQALNYFHQLLDALIYLHSSERGILYLDMKPANIMIRKDGEIRLIDFGIAQTMILKSKRYGSIGYSPPEQYVLGAKLSERTDVFALAMTLYVMLTGRKPERDLNKQIKAISKSREIPHFIKELILKCISFNESDRLNPMEIKHILADKGAVKRGYAPIMAMALLVVTLFVSLLVSGINGYKQYRCRKYKEEMYTKASECIEHGEYTLNGIKILCGYLDSGLLDCKTEEEVSYEVAKNYFEVQKDYANAGIYFKRVNTEDYPEAEEYLKVCNLMRRFSTDEKQLMSLFKEELGSNIKNE